jgi:Kef-type K+ transport system membrane component KefB
VTPSLVLLQLVVILVVCRVTSQLLTRLNQPVVVAQMLSGILIGPSLLGLWPEWQRLLFPPASVAVINSLGELGLVLFMFGVGTELDLGVLRRRLPEAAAITTSSIVIPLAIGALVASRLAGDGRLFPATAGRGVEIGFLAVALAITAFPVMAQIVKQAGLLDSVVGTTALAAGSLTDVVAWCLLAVLLATMTGSVAGAVGTVAAALVLLGLVLVARRTRVAGLLVRGLGEWALAPWRPPLLLLALLLGAWASDVAGLHPAFGAFLVGLAMPRVEMVTQVRERARPVVDNVLLPLFFVSTGLNTRVSLILGPGLPLIAVGLLATACLVKGVSCWISAQAAGHSPREALGIGALMNARGLVELVVLGIGLQRGVITPTLFSIMVLVAVATTMMAGPVLAAALPYAALRLDPVPADLPILPGAPAVGRLEEWEVG